MTEEFILAQINDIKTEIDKVEKEIKLMKDESGKLFDLKTNPVRFEIYKRLLDKKELLQNTKHLWANKLPKFTTQGNKLIVYISV